MIPLEKQLDAATHSCVMFRPAVIPIIAEGPDATRYLQGRVTQDIASLKPGTGAKSLLLSPQGRVLGQFSIYRRDNDFLLFSEPAEVEDPYRYFSESLLRFKVADQVELRSLEQTHQVISLIGPESRQALAKLGIEAPRSLHEHTSTNRQGEEIFVTLTNRGGTLGFDLLIPSSLENSFTSQLETEAGVPAGSKEGLEHIRIAAGIPAMGTELSEKVQATDIDVTELISFNKGCYAGQEMVEMSIARGRPNRQLLLLEGRASSPLSVGSTLALPDDESANCGTISSSSFLEQEEVVRCLAFIKTKHADQERFVVNGVELTRAQPRQ